MALPPGPRQPGVAQVLQFTLRPLPFLEESLERYGDPFTIRMGTLGTYVALTAPALIKEVFTGDSDVLHAGEANVILEPIVGKTSLLLLDGKPHARQRRLLMPPLHGERMQAYSRLMRDITAAALDRMPLGKPFALHAHMQSITLQVILRAVFGLAEGAQLDALGRLIVELLDLPPTIVTFVPPKYLDFPGSPYRSFVARRDQVDRELRSLIRARQAAAHERRTDILSLLLSARDEDGQPMTEDELRDELMTILVAGHETTATALSWAMICLLQSLPVTRRLESELDGARTADGDFDIDAVSRLEYLDAVIKESMRLRPILPDVVRRTCAPVRIAGYEIPIGTRLMPCIYLAHRRAESYPEPERFRPERFLGVKADPYAWLPFGGGIRRCIGAAFALHEMKIVLGELLLRADFQLADAGPVRTVRRGITLAPSGGARVVMVERASRRQGSRWVARSRATAGYSAR